jgi:hypothetical protein
MRLLASSTKKRSTTQNAASIRGHGVLQPLLVRPRAAIAERETVPVCIREMTDAQLLEARLVELSLVVKSFLCLHAAP